MCLAYYNVLILSSVTMFHPGRIHQPCGHFAPTPLNTWHVTMYRFLLLLQCSIPAESISHAPTLHWLCSIHDMLQCIDSYICHNVQSLQNRIHKPWATLLWLHSIHDMLQCIKPYLCYNARSRQNPSAMRPLCSDSVQYMTCYASWWSPAVGLQVVCLSLQEYYITWAWKHIKMATALFVELFVQANNK